MVDSRIFLWYHRYIFCKNMNAESVPVEKSNIMFSMLFVFCITVLGGLRQRCQRGRRVAE